MKKKTNTYFLLVFSVLLLGLLFSGCNKTISVDSTNLEGEWTYTNGLAELIFDNEGNAAAITPSGETTKTVQLKYELDGEEITFTQKSDDKIVLIANIEIEEKDGSEYLTLSNLHDEEGQLNPTSATFEKISDSIEAIE